MSRKIRISSIIVAVFSLSLYFVNCARGLPDIAADDRASSTGLGTYTVSVSPNSVTPGGSAQVSALNGTAPYSYSISSGTARIDGNGLITQTNSGTIIIEVDDSAGRQGFTTLLVAPTITPVITSKSCATPWGTTLADGATAPGFVAASVSCPATCTASSVTCANGNLSGTATAASCSIAACVYKETASNVNCLAAEGGLNNFTLVNAVPATCAAASYHSSLCGPSNSALGEGQFECVSPSESP